MAHRSVLSKFAIIYWLIAYIAAAGVWRMNHQQLRIRPVERPAGTMAVLE